LKRAATPIKAFPSQVHQSGDSGHVDPVDKVQRYSSAAQQDRKLGVDFSFNTIKNVQKVPWKEEAPWYREITDGFSWIAYCFNPNCPAFKQMVVINRGYCIISIKSEIPKLKCPVCKKVGSDPGGKGAKPKPYLHLRNCGFVNCEW